ncbi:cell envelope biogenesis protein TolA [Bartonella grahamii]|uniref:cell envelope biogenesis protein TolA n=1 Tax=Bartonella grahamii TaxID=33045 RepID=UPI003AF343A3
MPLKAPEDVHKDVPEMPFKAPEDVHKDVPEMPLKAPKDAYKDVPEMPLKAPEDAHKDVPEMPLKAPEDVHKDVPEMPLKALEDVHKDVPEMPLKALEDVHKDVPEIPLKAPKDAHKDVPEMPLKAPKDVHKDVPEMPLKAPKDVHKDVPEMPLKAPEDAHKDVPEMPLKAPKDAPKDVPEMPLKAPKDVLKDVLKLAHKNEEMISPKELAQTVQKVPAEQIFHQAPKIALPEKPLLPQFKPKFDEEFPRKNRDALNQKMPKLNKKNQEKQTIEDILAMEENNLLNRARSQGGGAKRSHTPEALGARKNVNDTTKMAQTLVNIVGGCIQQKLKLVALGGDLKNRPVVRLRFYLDREGMIVGDPIIDSVSGLESQQAIMIRQVYAAVFSCQPYADLPRDQYDLWGQGFDFNVDPLQEIR